MLIFIFKSDIHLRLMKINIKLESNYFDVHMVKLIKEYNDIDLRNFSNTNIFRFLQFICKTWRDT